MGSKKNLTCRRENFQNLAWCEGFCVDCEARFKGGNELLNKFEGCEGFCVDCEARFKGGNELSNKFDIISCSKCK